MKHIVILAPFTSLPGEPIFNRFLYLAELCSRKYSVTLVTSNFYHPTKSHRSFDEDYFQKLPFELILIDEPGYKKNASIDRVFSHYLFVKGVKNWLTTLPHKNIDIIYSAYPLIATNILISKYKKQLNYKIIIDVQDIWPESFSAVIPLMKKIPWLLWPISKKANKAYSVGDGLVSVSNTYLKRAKTHNPETPSLVVYIGADKKKIDFIDALPNKNKNKKLLYIGTISYSYDLETVVMGFQKLQQENNDIELHIMGDGPNREYIESISGRNVFFHGLVQYDAMISFAKSCNILINPIVSSALQSVTNKLSDYMLLGLPIINSQTNKEVIELINLTEGVHYKAGSADSFYSSSRKLLSQLRNNTDTASQIDSRIEKLFDRNISYNKILHFISGFIDD